MATDHAYDGSDHFGLIREPIIVEEEEEEEELYLTPNRQMYKASHIIYKIKAIYTHAHMWTHVH